MIAFLLLLLGASGVCYRLAAQNPYNVSQTFSETGYVPRAATIADMNNDGLADVVIGYQRSSDGQVFLAIWLQSASHTFSDQPTSLTSVFPGGSTADVFRIAVADFDQDGKPDVLFGAAQTDQANLIYPGNGDGTISNTSYELTYQSGLLAGVGDVNGDGIPDIVMNLGTYTTLIGPFTFNSDGYATSAGTGVHCVIAPRR